MKAMSALRELLAVERSETGLPVGQQLLRMSNDSQTECYSNATTAVLLGNPLINSFLSTVTSGGSGLINAVRGLTGCRPNTFQSGRHIRSELVRAVPGAAHFADYREQEDSHEYLTWLLEGLEREMPVNLQNGFVSLFALSTKVTSCCTAGLHSKEKVEQSGILSLPIQHPVTGQLFGSLGECFSNYFTGEVVEVDCQKCPSKQANQIRAVTGDDPDVLLVHLNRFDNHGRKLGHAIKFQPFLPGKSDDKRYMLTGVILHKGESVQRGHYRTVIRCVQSGRLSLLNDEREPLQIHETEATLNAMFQQAFIFVFSKEDKTAREVNKMVDLTSHVGTELGEPVAESVVPSPMPVEEGGEQATTDSREESKRKARDSTLGTPSVPRKRQVRSQHQREQVFYSTS